MVMGETSMIRVGVSSCLLGEPVRYDGGHKLDRHISDTLGRYVTLLPVCPEVGCGLPVPRAAMRLEGEPVAPRLVVVTSGIDLTERMRAFCDTRVRELEGEVLSGVIFKSRSPSCGLFRVTVYNKGRAAKNGRGLFAAAVARHFPLLPLEEEGRLNDPAIRENFIERVFGYRRWQAFLAAGPTPGRLFAFHTEHKLLLMAHSPELYRTMGALVAHGRELPRAELFQQYAELFMKALALHATTRKHTNVLQHVMGYFKRRLSRDEKSELLEVIGQFHDGLVPLVVPVTLLRHYVAKYDQQYLNGQIYLAPCPAQLMLRNHV